VVTCTIPSGARTETWHADPGLPKSGVSPAETAKKRQALASLLLWSGLPIWQASKEDRMPPVTYPLHKEGDFLVDYEEKVFEDVKAAPGEKALVTFHTVAFEGSIGLVNMLQATRLMRKGFETSVLLYGPGVLLGVQRGFPKLGSEAFPGHLVVNQKIGGFMAEGGKVYACRFALSALYGQTEQALIPGVRPINPLDVLDLVLLHRKAGAFILNTWTL
jgi:uncharacterized repeat protein (TIGR04044 family)